MLFHAPLGVYNLARGLGDAVSPPADPGRSPGGSPGGEAVGKFLGVLGYFRSTNTIYKALFVRKTLVIPFLVSFRTLWREVVLSL